MDRTEIEFKVKSEIANSLGVLQNKILNTDQLTDDLGADSLDMVELVMALEEEFGLEIPHEDWVRESGTVQDVINYIVDKKLGERNPV